MGSIVLYMYMSEKTDRVIWQVTDTTGVPILGRVQAKLMKYISYPEIHAPQEHEVFSLTRQSQICRLHTQSKDYKPQSTVCKNCTVYGQCQDYTQN